MKNIVIEVRKAESAQDFPLPSYATAGASGMDLLADVNKDTQINPHEIKLISCGIYLAIPEGFEAEIRPRSGLALNTG